MNKNPVWKKSPSCELCQKEPATSFSCVDGRWAFVGSCATNVETYYVQLNRFFASPASTVDWLAHLNEKKWMDWRSFMDMMRRFRTATDSFGSTN